MDGNEFRESLEEARRKREALQHKRDEVENLINSLCARQLAVQQALEQARALKQLDLNWITNQRTLAMEKKEQKQLKNDCHKLKQEDGLKQREKSAGDNNSLSDVRSDILDKRDKAAQKRNHIADQRDDEADAREQLQNAREAALDERERKVKEQEKVQENREKFLRRREQRDEEEQSG